MRTKLKNYSIRVGDTSIRARKIKSLEPLLPGQDYVTFHFWMEEKKMKEDEKYMPHPIVYYCDEETWASIQEEIKEKAPEFEVGDVALFINDIAQIPFMIFTKEIEEN